MDITIRKGTIEDAPLIAQVVAIAIGDADTMKGYCGENYLEVLEEIARLEDSQYSYRHSLVAQVDGTPVGAIIGYDGGLLDFHRKQTLSVILQYNPELKITDDETQAGEFYLDSLGVLPDFRGLGIGKRLMTVWIDHVFSEKKHPCVGLLVDYNNTKAERLYSSLGFKRVNTRLFLGHPMWHMQKTNGPQARESVSE